MPENPTNLLGPLIRQYRERYGMSLVEMAKLSGLSPSTILRIEQNKVAPSKQAINNIAQLMLKTLQTSKLNDDVISKKIHSYTILENFSIDEREKYRRSYKNPDASMREVAAFLLSQKRIQSIPKQGISVHFAVEAGQIKTIPTQYFGEDENDYLRIDSLRPSLLRFSDAAQHALGRSDAYRNILEVIKRYHSECEKPITEINYAILYGYGIELQYAYDSLLADIVNGETPELSADQRAPMESLLQLHGPFILASKDGRELVTDAERYARSPQEEKEFQVAINELGNEIACNPDVVAADTARVLNELKAVPDGAKQYERWYRLNRGAFRNFVIVAAGASVAATLAAAASTGSPLLIIAGAVASWISFEGIKKSKSYGTLTQEIGRILDDASNSDLCKAGQAASLSLLKIREFVIKNKELLKRIGGSSREMEWIDQALQDIEEKEFESEVVEKKLATQLPKYLADADDKENRTRRGIPREIIKPIFAGRISKKSLFRLKEGVFLLSNSFSKEGPLIAETIGNEIERMRLWRKITDSILEGRKFYAFEDESHFHRWSKINESFFEKRG